MIIEAAVDQTSDHQKTHTVVVLPGEGVGPEVVAYAKEVMLAAMEFDNIKVNFIQGLIGEPAIAATGKGLPDETLELCRNADAIIFGAVSKHGLLELRSGCNFYANLRPVTVWPELQESSTVKAEVISGVDILFVRELISGLYFGPSGTDVKNGQPYAFHTMQYYDYQIRQVARVALQAAQNRTGAVVLAHKENALPKIRWCQLVKEVATDFEGIELQPMLVDTVAMELIRSPGQFDVILSGNLFGDILSDIGAGLVGSIGLLPSASINDTGKGMYEAIHGTAPSLVGKNRVNPIATLMSVAMLFKNWGYEHTANRIESGIRSAVRDGYRTPDIAENNQWVGSREFINCVIERMDNEYSVA